VSAGGERFADVGRGITLCYEEIGDPGGRPLLLVAGLGMQLNSWPTPFCEALAGRGFRVVRFDNRDVGRSTHLSFRPPSPVAMLTGRMPAEQYHLGDLARDAAGLLEALEVDAAHVVGASMGGMIAQTLAAHHPGRVATLVSIMSTTGARRIGRPAPSTWRRMLGRPPRSRAESAERAVAMFRHIGSHGFPYDADAVRTMAGEAWDRDPTTAGVGRQLAGIIASGDRTAELRTITAPTLVIHGDRDRMVHPSGAAATARAVPGARLVTIAGMGHDLPVGAYPRLVDLIAAHAGAERPAPQ
jgi:pimeloyl-ACP methyl ester carboxylesterase